MMISAVRPYAYAVVAIIIAGLALHAWQLSQRLDVAQGHLAICRGNAARLRADLDKQSAAVRAHAVEAEKARAAAAAARADAERAAARHDQRAADLRQWQRREAEDDCAAARRLLIEVSR